MNDTGDLVSASDSPLEMSAKLLNPLTDEQGIEYLQTLRQIGNVHVWRRPCLDPDGSILYHKIFVRSWPGDAASVAEALALIARNHPANRVLFK